MKRFVFVISILLIMSGCTLSLKGFGTDQGDPTSTPTKQPGGQPADSTTSKPSKTPLPTSTPGPTVTPSLTPIPEGHVIIPEMVGWKREDAYQALKDLGLVPKTFWVIPVKSFVYNDVTGSEPADGEVVKKGTVVILDVVGVVKDCK